MIATFEDDPARDEACECCEYRQYVRGTFRVNGVSVPHWLPGGLLHPVRYQEDGIPNFYGPNHHFYYGRRAQRGTAHDRYLPRRADGCRYVGSDFPGVVGPPGTRFEIDLHFRGEIVDVCNGGQVIASTTWFVRFSGTL
jgi:hypothetical protein